jgi:secondary thiamine-phosphate synthase enzyme
MALPIRAHVGAGSTWSAVHDTISLETAAAIQFVDITVRLEELVWRHRLSCGLVSVQTRHTTTGIVVNEDEPLLLEDLRRTLERVAPRLGGYAHDDFRRRRVNLVPGERVNGHAHCQALVLPSASSINVAGGALCLGRWQRVFLVELDGPQRREVSVMLMGLVGASGPRPVA